MTAETGPPRAAKWFLTTFLCLNPLIKSPAEDLPQDTQQEQSSGKGEDS
jgi:hypothetical protein